MTEEPEETATMEEEYQFHLKAVFEAVIDIMDPWIELNVLATVVAAYLAKTPEEDRQITKNVLLAKIDQQTAEFAARRASS